MSINPLSYLIIARMGKNLNIVFENYALLRMKVQNMINHTKVKRDYATLFSCFFCYCSKYPKIGITSMWM